MRKKWITLAVALALLAGTAQEAAAATTAKLPATATKKLVNLNAASREELKGLPGGSDAEAARIVAGRPYNSKAFLVTKKVISEARYAAIKSLVVAGEPAKPPAARK